MPRTSLFVAAALGLGLVAIILVLTGNEGPLANVVGIIGGVLLVIGLVRTMQKNRR